MTHYEQTRLHNASTREDTSKTLFTNRAIKYLFCSFFLSDDDEDEDEEEFRKRGRLTIPRWL